MFADRLPARRCRVALADVAHGQRRDGFPQPVVRGKDAVVAVAVLPRRRHEVRESGNYDLGRGLRRRQKHATKAGAGRFEKPAPDARAAPPEAHESLISPKTVAEVPLTGLSFLLSRALHACAAGMAVTLRAVGMPGLSGTGGASGPSRPSLKPKKISATHLTLQS